MPAKYYMEEAMHISGHIGLGDENFGKDPEQIGEPEDQHKK